MTEQQHQSNLPDEILNLRIPIYRLFIVVNDNSKKILIWHHIQSKLIGGRPVEKLVRQALCCQICNDADSDDMLQVETLFRDNERALEELKSLVEMYVESCSLANSNLSNKKQANNNSNNKNTPLFIPAPPNSVSQQHRTSVVPPLMQQNSSPSLENVSGDRGVIVPGDQKTTFEAFIESIPVQKLNQLAEHQRKGVNTQQDELILQIQNFVRKENMALLADAEDVRRLIAKPKNLAALLSLDNNNMDNFDDYYYQHNNDCQSLSSARAGGSRVSTARELIRPSSACSRSTYHLQQQNQTAFSSSPAPRTGSVLSNSSCSSSTPTANHTTCSSSSASNDVHNKNRRMIISESTTSKVRSNLLARMRGSGPSYNQDNDDEEEKKGDDDDDNETTKKQLDDEDDQFFV